MRYALALAGLSTLVAGQTLDFDAIASAPAPVATGPAVTATAELIDYSAAATGSAAVTATALAAAVDKRALEERTLNINALLCLFLKRNCPSSTTTTAKSTTKCTTSTAAPSTTAAASTTTTTAAPTFTNTLSIKPTPTGIPTTCTNTWTNTFEFTSATDCPDIFEVGTYCGFVNPEDPCADQPAGSGAATTNPDTPAAFLANPVYKNLALSAKTPSGYAQTFKNLNASTSAATYLGLTTLTAYDPSACSALCDSTDSCTSFNIYIERDPSLNPSTTYCCPNPASLTNYKCTLWGSTIDATTATNAGQGREGFQVVITGSNGYTKANTTTPDVPEGCSNPKKCKGAHSHSSTCIGNHFFPGPYNPQLCASYAQAQNIKNGANIGRGSSRNHCNFFNSYMLKKDGKPLGTYCSLFAKQYDNDVATYVPGWKGNSFYDVETSWSFCLN